MYLSSKELGVIRGKLISMRAALQDNVEHLEQSARAEAPAGVSFNHLAETGSDSFEEDMSLEQLQNEENILYEIDEALSRIDRKEYGLCASCEKKISKERLNVRPFARLCLTCQEEAEAEAESAEESGS